VAAGLRVALVHEWLITHGGSEEITAELCALFPGADLFTLVADPVPSLRAAVGARRVVTSFLQRIPGATRAHRALLPLMPRAAESFDLRGHDLVISVSHAVAKSVRTVPGQVHVCICCSPMRYAWDLRAQYLRESGLAHGVKGWLAGALLDRLKRWDLATAGRPTAYLAISGFIADRIRRAYGRESRVLYPPVDTGFFTPVDGGPSAAAPDAAPDAPFYVTASRLVPYKRMPLIVEAFARMPERRLVVIGDGPEMPKVRAAAGPNVTILGHQSREALRDHLRRARGFVFAAEEDFGIVPVEAMACGTPVVAYGVGGVRETVRAGETGVFFGAQDAAAIAAAVGELEGGLASGRITAAACRRQAERFSAAVFRAGLREELARVGHAGAA
jgi:glycosyltransferase involved in cell wall biosynthesis